MRKAIGWTVALVVALSAALGVWRWRRAASVVEADYRTAPVERRRISAKVTASGTLQATVTVQVGAQVSGRIAQLFADFNSTVKKGQLIAKIDRQLLQAAAAQANANYVSAKAGVTKAVAQGRDAEMVRDRAKALAGHGLATGAELQTAETNVQVAAAQVDVAKAALEQATAALNQARVNLSYTDIFSPIDGTVISRNVDVGQTVASSLQAPVLFTIAEDLRKIQVHTSVAEGDVGRIAEGMSATFTVDAYPGQRFTGKVAQIRNAAQTVQNVVTYVAVVDVDNGDLRLRPGMTATVTVVFAERESVLAVSNAALRFRPPAELATLFPSAPSRDGSSASEGGAPGTSPRGPRSENAVQGPRAVWVLRGGAPASVELVTGLSDGTVSEVVSGAAAEGDLVIVDATVRGQAKPASSGRAPSMGRMF